MEHLKTKYGREILEVQDDFGRIPLHYAAHFDNVQMVKVVLNKQKSLAILKTKKACPHFTLRQEMVALK